jgi:hypothetical protein
MQCHLAKCIFNSCQFICARKFAESVPLSTIYSSFKVSNCLMVSSKALCSVSKSANFFFSTSCNSWPAFSLYAGSSRIFLCLSIPIRVLSNFLLAFWISPSMSTRPLTWRKTAASEETGNTTHPGGRASEAESIDKEATPFPESDLIDWIWDVAVLWDVESYVCM